MTRFNLLICLVISFSCPFSYAERLVLASTNWCPYICDSETEPGFIVEYMTALLAKDGVKLEVEVLPWLRAIEETRKGRYDGLLTAVQSEAPDFLFTDISNGTYQLCFYKKESSDFQYEERSSLQNILVGGIKGYGYDEPIESIRQSPMSGEALLEVSSDGALESLINMLLVDRLDTVIEDKAVMEYELNRASVTNIVEAGCLFEHEFYVALSPQLLAKTEIMKKLNRVLAQENAMTLRQYYRNNYR